MVTRMTEDEFLETAQLLHRRSEREPPMSEDHGVVHREDGKVLLKQVDVRVIKVGDEYVGIANGWSVWTAAYGSTIEEVFLKCRIAAYRLAIKHNSGVMPFHPKAQLLSFDAAAAVLQTIREN